VDDTHPVNCVSFEDALAYLDWLSTETGETYRLLTEAEWEFAVRAGSTLPYFFGDDPASLCSFANGADQSAKALNPDWTWANGCSDGPPVHGAGRLLRTKCVRPLRHDRQRPGSAPPCDFRVSRGGACSTAPACCG
jgi:formylglycine-generating enzyme required for sulfatase activity